MDLGLEWIFVLGLEWICLIMIMDKDSKKNLILLLLKIRKLGKHVIFIVLIGLHVIHFGTIEHAFMDRLENISLFYKLGWHLYG